MSVEIVSWENGTDEQIAAMLDAAAAGEIDLQQDGGWAVGDRRVITLTGLGMSGETQQNAIIITSFDEYMGCGNLLQFDFEDSPTSNSMEDGNLGYRYTRTYRYESKYIVDSMPVLFRHRLKTFDVLYDAGDGQTENIITIPGNKLAHRSRKEVFGDGSSEGSYISYYSTLSHRIKKRNGWSVQRNNQQPEPAGWWLRTSNGSEQYYYVTAEGDINSADSDTVYFGLSLFGCLGGYNGTLLQKPIAINSYNFPDEAFRQAVSTFDLDNDGYLSQYEMEKCVSLWSSTLRFSSAKSLIGINLLTCVEKVYIDLDSEFTDEDVDLSALTLLDSCTISIYRMKNILLHGANLRSLRLTNCNNFEDIEYVQDPIKLTTLQINFFYPTETVHRVDVTRCSNLKFLLLSGFICDSIDIRNNPRLLLAHSAPQNVPRLTWEYGIRTSGSSLKGSVRAVETQVVYNAGQNPLQQQFPEDNLTMATYRLVYDLQSTVVTNAFSITEDASDVSAKEGANAIFSCQALSDSELQYLWQYRNYFTNMASSAVIDWTRIGDGKDLTIKASAALEYYAFRCYIYLPSSRRAYYVEDQDGSNQRNEYFYHLYGYTRIAHLKVYYPIKIIEQPKDSINKIGDISDFTVKASNDPPRVVDDDQTWYHPDRTQKEIKYLWQSSSDDENYEDILGATSKTLSVVVDDNADDISYRCIVSDNTDELTTNIVRVILADGTGPVIISHPSSITVIDGEDAIFLVIASGNDTSYQWQTLANGSWTDIRNATASTYSFTASLSGDGKQYRCKVFNSAGTVYSNAATLTVEADTSLALPVITTQPESVQIEEGESFTFSVGATGEDLRYQWQIFYYGEWINLGGQNTATTYNMYANAYGKQYRCAVSNPAGTVYSDVAVVTVIERPSLTPPSITYNPVSRQVKEGTVVSFSVTAKGVGLRYQWQTREGTTWYPISDATESTYSVSANLSMNGKQYRCVVTNEAGAATSTAATLTVNPIPDPTPTPTPTPEPVRPQSRKYWMINGLDILPYVIEGGIKWSRNDVDGDNAGRVIGNADMTRDRLAIKMRCDMSCRPLFWQDINKIMQAIKPEFVTVQYNDPMEGSVTKIMYSNNATATLGTIYDDNTELYEDLTFPLIEK